MLQLIFQKACRQCNQGIDMDTLITDWHNDLEFYKNLTDFEISQSLEETMKNNRVDCEFCGANNWDIWSIKVNDYQPYDVIRLNDEYSKEGSYVLIFDLPKRNNQGHHTIYRNRPATANTFLNVIGFESKCKTEIKKIINSIPTTKCINHSDGTLYFCFSGNDTNCKLEIFRYIGFTKEDLLNITNQMTEV